MATPRSYTVTVRVEYRDAPESIEAELRSHFHEAIEAGTILEDEDEQAVVNAWSVHINPSFQ